MGERPDASETISISHERAKRSLERAYGGSRCGRLEVNFERADEYALDSVVAQVMFFFLERRRNFTKFSQPIRRK